MGEPSKDSASVIKDDLFAWSKELALVEPYLEVPFEELCGESVMVGTTPSFEHIDFICIKPLDLTTISFPFAFYYPLSFACISQVPRWH